jgi:hypothetical protein
LNSAEVIGGAEEPEGVHEGGREDLNSSVDGGGTKYKHTMLHVIVSYHLSAESGRELSFEKLAEKQTQSGGGDEEDKGARGDQSGWEDEITLRGWKERAAEETHSMSKEACMDNMPSEACGTIAEGCCVSDTVHNIPSQSCGGLDWSDEAQAGGGGGGGHKSKKTLNAIPLRKRTVQSTLSEAVVGGGGGGARTAGGEEGAGITFGDRGVWTWGKRGIGRGIGGGAGNVGVPLKAMRREFASSDALSIVITLSGPMTAEHLAKHLYTRAGALCNP